MTSPRARHAPLFALLGLVALLIAVSTSSRATARTRADVLKVQEDIRFLVTGVQAYHAHTGTLPGRLVELVHPMVNARGETSPSYAATIPNPQPRWTAYTYLKSRDDVFSVFSFDGGVTVRSVGDDIVVETHSITR